MFIYAIVVCDNDSEQSAKQIIDEFQRASVIGITYCVEPQRNIALARNRALAHASGKYIAFIDDDEFPDKEWLAALFNTCEQYDVDGVLGPVRPHFDQSPPLWIMKGRFCERPEHSTGTVLHWRETRTGNALIKRSVLDGIQGPFEAEFGNGGEDQDFFRRMIEQGHRFVWCNKAFVYEVVPPERWTRRYMLKRALLRGQNERFSLSFRSVGKSVMAATLYAITLPVALFLGQHVFMRYTIRFFDHVGKVLTACGVRALGDRYL